MIANPNGSVPEARIEVLCKVREILRYEKERYICYAIRLTRCDFPHLSGACDDIEAHVHIGINGYSSLQNFIVAEMFGMERGWMSFPDPYRYDYYFNKGVMQMARLAWIDKMIEDLTTNEKEIQNAHQH